LRASSGAAVAFALLTVVAIGAEVSAHRLDEYLQAARIAIDPDRVEIQLDLTPGVAVAGAVIADIDRDRDGRLSPDEKRAYVQQVLSGIALELDGHALRLEPATLSFPDVDAMRSGEDTIRLQLRAALPSVSEGPHRLSYRNNHRRDVSVYLANALVPESGRVAVRAQLRDTDQRDLTVAYTLRAVPDTFPREWLLLGIACAAGAIVSLRSANLARSEDVSNQLLTSSAAATSRSPGRSRRRARYRARSADGA
jgi:hypothetical protein